MKTFLALEVSSDDLPNFKKLTECESAALCIKVTYANGEEDMITADEFHGERHAKHDVYKGRLASTNAKVVVILKDESHEKDLVVFKCKKAHSCHNFRVDLEVSLHTGLGRNQSFFTILGRYRAQARQYALLLHPIPIDLRTTC